MNKLRMESPDMTAQNIDRIATLFPNCITEMLDEKLCTSEKKVYKRAVNFELLKQMLSPDLVDGKEAYEFIWVGKKAAIMEANKPIRKTLRPCVEESKNWDTTENLYIEGDLIACFDECVPESVVREIAKRKPLRAVFRDSGFTSSPEKINVFEIFKLYMPEDANDITKRVRVI